MHKSSDVSINGVSESTIVHALKLAVVALNFPDFATVTWGYKKKHIFSLSVSKRRNRSYIYIDFYSSAVCFGPAKPGASVSIWALSNIFSRGSGCGKATEANRRECVNGYMCVCVCVLNNTLRLSQCSHWFSALSCCTPRSTHFNSRIPSHRVLAAAL